MDKSPASYGLPVHRGGDNRARHNDELPRRNNQIELNSKPRTYGFDKAQGQTSVRTGELFRHLLTHFVHGEHEVPKIILILPGFPKKEKGKRKGFHIFYQLTGRNTCTSG
jgi:hypothetical protein